MITDVQLNLKLDIIFDSMLFIASRYFLSVLGMFAMKDDKVSVFLCNSGKLGFQTARNGKKLRARGSE